MNADDPIACIDQPWPYDTLIDFKEGETFKFALSEALRICGGCPVRDKCMVENRDEQWAQAIINARNKPTGICAWCSKTFTIPKRGNTKRYCNDRTCGYEARKNASRSAA